MTTSSFLLLILLVTLAFADDSLVQTSNGVVRGIVQDTFRVFKSIPFAAPPVGALRWKSPKPATSWAPSVYDATKFRDSCVQDCILPDGLCGDSYSEDCLYLNVYTPRNVSAGQKLPVMVFLPGGDMIMGTSNCVLYDGRFLAASKNVIIVGVNYRLGALGFLVNTDLGLNGNYGFQDQRMAFTWVRDNIAAFGGDPTQVTIQGESAGAFSVAGHVASPLSAGLFNKAIMQSVPIMLPYRTLQSATKLGNEFARVADCRSDTLNCLGKLNDSAILAAQDAAGKQLIVREPLVIFCPWTPAIDGKELIYHPMVAIQRGEYNKVPIMIGANAEEARMFIYLAVSTPMGAWKYTGILFALFTTHLPSVEALYPATHEDRRDDLAVLGTDLIFLAPSRNVSMNAARYNQVFFYEFNHAPSFNCWLPRYPFCNTHACHGAELPYVFNTAQLQGFKFTPEEQEMSSLMMDYWTNFAHSGNPNVGPSVASMPWPMFNQTTLYNVEFATPKSTTVQNFRKKYCDYWDRNGYNWGPIRKQH